jgi:hypothetical protein
MEKERVLAYLLPHLLVVKLQVHLLLVVIAEEEVVEDLADL